MAITNGQCQWAITLEAQFVRGTIAHFHVSKWTLSNMISKHHEKVHAASVWRAILGSVLTDPHYYTAATTWSIWRGWYRIWGWHSYYWRTGPVPTYGILNVTKHHEKIMDRHLLTYRDALGHHRAPQFICWTTTEHPTRQLHTTQSTTHYGIPGLIQYKQNVALTCGVPWLKVIWSPNWNGVLQPITLKRAGRATCKRSGFSWPSADPNDECASWGIAQGLSLNVVCGGNTHY